MSYPDNFSSAAYRDRFERTESARAADNTRIAEAASTILGAARIGLAALQQPPGTRTAEMIDEAVAWIDEQREAIRAAAAIEAQDL